MLRTAIRRIPLSRAVHTSRSAVQSSNSYSRVGPAAAAAVAAVTFFGWQLSRQDRLISLDSESKGKARAEGSIGLDSPSAPQMVKDKVQEAKVSVDEVLAEGGEAEEEEDSGSAAFDPVTGEINWDCPCLGGMAHGPCGQEFRDAFSCFVFSEKEPKGVDCVEKFRGMQDCFRAHPEVYGEELADEEEDETEMAPDSERSPPNRETVPPLPTTDSSASSQTMDGGELPSTTKVPQTAGTVPITGTVLTEPEVHFLPDPPPENGPALPKTGPPPSSPITETTSDTPSKRF